MNETDDIKVFISYSHDSKDHKARVLQLAKRLEKNGIECSLDQYEDSPPEGWVRWMSKQIKEAKFVVVVCTEIYQERYEGDAEPGVGIGAKWEGLTITQELYKAEGRNSKFIPVVFSTEDTKYIPNELSRGTWYVLNDEGYLELYRRITNQPHVQKGPLGERLILPPDEIMSNAQAVEPPAAETADLPSSPVELGKRPSHEQVLEVLGSIEKALEGTSLDKVSPDPNELDPFTIVRHHLFSTALTALQISSIMPGIRDTQRLYLYRERLESLPLEKILLLRTLINDADGLIPGWYWFSHVEEKAIKTLLFKFALKDQNASVRARAWEMLAAARIPPVEDPTTWAEYLKSMLSDEAHVKKAGMSYLGVVGTKRDLPTIKSAIDDSSVSNEATISRFLVLARSSPGQVLTESIPKFLTDKKKIISELKAHVGNISKDALLRALQNKNTDEDVKFVAIEELKRKNYLTDDTASSLLEDSSGRVAEVCYRQLIGQGKKFAPDDIYLKVGDDTYNRQHGREYFFRDPPYADFKAVILEMYRSYTIEDLRKLTAWQSDYSDVVSSNYGDVAYKALSLYHFNEESSRIRDDLNQEFKADEGPYLEAATIRRLKQKEEEKSQPFSTRPMDLFAGAFTRAWSRRQNEKEPTPEESAKSETEGVKNKYIAAALAGIAQNGEADDITFGRGYLSRDDYDVLVEAVKVIERFGDEDDIQNLIDVAKKKEGVLQESAARAALKLSPDVKETARALLLTAKEDLAGVVVGFLADNQDISAMLEFMESLLREESDIVRRKVMALLAKKLTIEELEGMLSRYPTQLYYYDVVSWFDKILYAPEPLKGAFAHQLEEELITHSSDA